MKAKLILKLVVTTMAALAGPIAFAAEQAVVYKNPTCACCGKWIEHMRASGFDVKVENVNDVVAVKSSHGVPAALSSCHTTLIDGYVVEGHVPAKDIKRLLRERPAVAGLAVAGMPPGAPGMGGNGRGFTVTAFERGGSTSIYAKY